MPPKEPTRHQLSSRLAYNAQTPAFLRRFQNQVAGRPTDEDEDEDDPQYIDGVDEFGRERRPAIPERPQEDGRGSDDEDNAEEKPVVVVLKEGKHLNEEEAEDERRKAKGLPPLPKDSQPKPTPSPLDTSAPSAPPDSPKISHRSGLSFSSTKHEGGKPSAAKRKAPDGKDPPSGSKPNPKKKSKKNAKGLLSFDEV